MASKIIDERRITIRNDCPSGDGEYVLYWMQAAVRSGQNHALEFAIQAADEVGLPLVVGFGLDRNYSEATPRTLQFLVEGVVDAAGRLRRRGIDLVVRAGNPLAVARELSKAAAAVVVDRAYLREPREWRADLADDLDVRVWEVETNVVVPVEVVSDQREYAARTIRPKLHRHLSSFAVELATTPLRSGSRRLDGLPTSDTSVLLDAIGVSFDPNVRYHGGESQARAALERFLEGGLDDYAGESSTDVSGNSSSRLSMYLHYGHISPLEVLRKVTDLDAARGDIDAFVEELVVRRELAHNYVWYEPEYDSYRALPEWAQTTLAAHRDDPREVVYTRRELADAATGDPYWNAAMTEMRETGYLHNRMRMYWGKRIIEWTNTPEYAFRVALELNNEFLLDGRDPSSYANVGWVFGLHDQAFAERPVLGKVRPMTASGLERKIDTDAYVAMVQQQTGVDI